jgi:BirA family transcriptional regulator, biotin operon repressor / biotin---[acetyl-CoA-carboxylase] ligase
MTEPLDDVLDATGLRAQIESLRLPIGLPLEWVAQAGSTNDLASEAARNGASHGAMFLAEQQTAGRGRLGRRWHSPPGQNLYFSIVLRPELPADRLAPLTLVAGVAVADAIAMFVPSGDVKIKWPNDVLVGGRKVVGILVESSLVGEKVDYVVVGIGINVLQKAFDPEIDSIATSIALHATRPVRRMELLCALLEQLAKRLAQYSRDGLESMTETLHGRDAALGRNVKCLAGQGVGDGIEPDGRLRVLLADGTSVSIHSGEVEIAD